MKTGGQGGSDMTPHAAGIEGVATLLLEQQPQHQLRQSRSQLRPSTTTVLRRQTKPFRLDSSAKKKQQGTSTRINSATRQERIEY